MADNASQHTCFRMSVELYALLESAHIFPVFLPAYSPELNPVESIFAHTKNFLRRRRNTNAPFKGEIDRSFQDVTFPLLWSYYKGALSQ